MPFPAPRRLCLREPRELWWHIDAQIHPSIFFARQFIEFRPNSEKMRSGRGIRLALKLHWTLMDVKEDWSGLRTLAALQSLENFGLRGFNLR